MLGRPFGVPHDATFQERVLMAALRLLEASAGPVLEDYPDDAPLADQDARGIACPVSFQSSSDAADLGALFTREVAELLPWHDLARQRRGRSSVGLSGVSIEKTAELVAGILKGIPVANIENRSAGDTLKLLYEDVRTYYYEAAAARPGTPNASAIQNWFWQDTAAGRLFLALQQLCLASADKSLQQLCATSLVPKAVLMSTPKA